LVAARVDNSQAGRIAAKGAIDADLQGLDQHDRGNLVSDTGITLDLNKGSLVNRAQGLIATPGTLLLRQLGVVDNSGGEISSDRAFTLATSALNNQGGRLLSGGALTLRIAQALDNSLEGLVSGAGGLDIQAFVLDNRSGS
ncbi:TPA: hypothetical protein SL605_006563, partial [Pseudomonas aeruginosa]|nr:hypothetical protein [Pseudomonas aeruginosa]